MTSITSTASTLANPGVPPGVRASDADRDRTVELLREHWMAGRLTLAEFEARAAEAWRALYVAELWAAVRELPIPVPVPVPPPARPARASGAVASVVLGATGTALLLLSLGFLFLLTLPLTVTAWALGRGARRRTAQGEEGRTLAVTGEVLGLVGTVLACLMLAACAAVVAAV